MAMIERRLFNKPLARTAQNIASGVQVPVLTVPTGKLGYLKRIEANNPTDRAINIQIWDNYIDPQLATFTATGMSVPEVLASGFEKRKDIHIPANVEQINWDEDEDIPLLGAVQVFADASGVDVTLATRLIG